MKTCRIFVATPLTCFTEGKGEKNNGLLAFFALVFSLYLHNGYWFLVLLFQQDATQIESFIFKLCSPVFVEGKILVCLADYRLLFFFFSWESAWMAIDV